MISFNRNKTSEQEQADKQKMLDQYLKKKKVEQIPSYTESYDFTPKGWKKFKRVERK